MGRKGRKELNQQQAENKDKKYSASPSTQHGTALLKR